MQETEAEASQAEYSRFKSLPVLAKVAFIALIVAGVALSIFYIFGFNIRGEILLEWAYYFLLMALCLPCAFLVLPARKKDRGGLPWYDVLVAILTFGLCIYFFTRADEMSVIHWRTPTPPNLAAGTVLALIILEGARRTGGKFYLLVALILGLFPLYTGYLPGVLGGFTFSFTETIGEAMFGSAGLLGLPSKVLGELIMGFLLFAGLLVSSGAGKFFLNLCFALLGMFRGGPAKVAVLASGFFGSLSGGAISNVVATGSVTIPAMKRMGYAPHYAGAIEACASAGGGLMPPVMGAVAFIMAEFLGIEYRTVVIAAFIPAVLYYFGLLMQVDAYAARVGLRGMPRTEIPSLKKTLIEGWPFIVVLLFLVWGLVFMRWEAYTPFYAAGLLFVLSFVRRENWMTPRRIIAALGSIGTLIAQVVAIILPVGFIIMGLRATGVAGSLSGWFVYLGEGNVFLILVIGVVLCYIMGMVGMTAPAYIFMAVTMAPAAIKAGGLNPIATHLFILYYTMLAAITLPVAMAAFVGAAIAGAPTMKTGATAMRLGIVIYFIPFYFIFQPALIFQGPILETLFLFVCCLVGLVLIAAGLQGYLLKVGTMSFWTRIPLIIAGLLIAFPENITGAIGGVIAILAIATALIQSKRKASQPQVA